MVRTGREDQRALQVAKEAGEIRVNWGCKVAKEKRVILSWWEDLQERKEIKERRVTEGPKGCRGRKA